MFRRLAAATVAVILTTAAAAAATRTRVIVGDHSVGGLALARATPPDAIAQFAGDGVRRVHRNRTACSISWPRTGLKLAFGVIGTDPTNPCAGGHLFTATITNRSAWRTAVGLRVGDGVSRLRALYPHAVLHRDPGFERGYWLITRKVCAAVGGGSYPGLIARVRAGRVTALAAQIGVCD